MTETIEQNATAQTVVQRPVFMAQVRAAIRTRHYSMRTEEAYTHWIKRYIFFHGKRHPKDMGAQEVETFLSNLATQRQVAASTQNQALAALLFLYKNVLDIDLPWLDGITRAKASQHLPTVLTQAETASLLRHLPNDTNGLIIRLLYGTGMRLDGLLAGGDSGRAQRAELATARQRLADAEARLARLALALASDDGPTPITVLRQMREIEAAMDADRHAIAQTERELARWWPAPSVDLAERWLALFDGIEAQEVEARMQARELVRATFARIVLWQAGEREGPDYGQVIEMEITARGGGSTRLRIDRASGGVIDPH